MTLSEEDQLHTEQDSKKAVGQEDSSPHSGDRRRVPTDKMLLVRQNLNGWTELSLVSFQMAELPDPPLSRRELESKLNFWLSKNPSLENI